MLSKLSDEDERRAREEGEKEDEGVVLLEQSNQLLVSLSLLGTEPASWDRETS